MDFIIKVLEIVGPEGTEGMHLNTIKAMYKKPTANIPLNGERSETISLKSGTRQGFPLSTPLFNIVFQVLAGAIRQEKKINEKQIGKEIVQI